MNKEIMRQLGFEAEMKLVDEGRCPICGVVIDPEKEFRNESDKREYEISGFCQECQDKTFGIR